VRHACLRYSLITWLAEIYARHVISLWSGALQKWSGPLLWGFWGMLVIGVCVGAWKIFGSRKSDARTPGSQTEETAAD